jgi:hypothetical protein
MAKAVGERLVGGAKYIAGTEPEKRGSLIGDVVTGVERANVGAAGVFRALSEAAAPVLDPITGKILPENPLRRIASEFERLGKESEARIKAKAPTEEQDVISAGVSSGIQSLTQSLMAIPMAFLPGGQPAALVMLSTNTGGNAYQEARNKGLSPAQAIPYAVSQASIEYATEVMPLTKLVSDINQKTGFGKLLMNQIVREVPGEQVATVLQDMNDWAVLNPEKTAQQYLEERPSAAAQTLVATIVGVGGNVIVGKALQTVAGAGEKPEAPKVEPTLEAPEGFDVVSVTPIEPVTPVTPTAPPAPEAAPPAAPPPTEVAPEEITGLTAAEFEAPPEEAVTPVAEAVTPVTQETATEAPAPVEPPPVQNLTGGLPIQEIPIKDLKVSDEVPQFKIGATKEGVVEPLGGKFERTGVAPIQVWRRTDGSLEVISGRHRLDLAKRSKEKTIPAQIHDEAQGFTRDKAAILDAELNIRDGQGKVKDYVGYFKGSGISRDEADARGLLARAIGKRSYAIAADGSEELITAHRADAVGDEAAYLIALNAPKDASLQAVGIKAVQDGKSAASAVNLMQAVKTLAGERETTTDMFGFDESAMKEAEEMAKIAARKQREIQQRLSAISGASKNPELARKEGINIDNPEAVRQRVDELRQAKATWDNWSSSSDLIGQIRAEMGPSEFALQQQTEEDLRAQEAAAAEREAAEVKAIADREVGLFGLQPQVQEREAPPSGDLFGARGLAEQPAKKAPAAPPTETGLFAPKEEAPKDVSLSEAEFDALTARPYDELSRDEKERMFVYNDVFRSSGVEVIRQPENGNEINLKPYKNGYVASISYIGKKEGRSAPVSAFINESNPVYPDRKSAIKAKAEQIRDMAVKSKDRKALLWLGDVIRKEGITLDKALPVKPSKEKQAEINRERQAAKKEAVAAEEKPVKGDVLLLEADEQAVSEALEPSDPEDERIAALFNPDQKPAKPQAEETLTQAQAKKLVNSWKQEAKNQGKSGKNGDKTVISLFDASGEWAKPWADAGFNVVTYDLQTGDDIREFDAASLLEAHGNDNVWAILAAPPCTDFASSGAQYWAKKDAEGKTEASNELVRQVLRTVELFRPPVWAMENPVGRMAKLNELPPAQLTFQPNLYGDPYTKKTLLWGNFNNQLPESPVAPTEGSKITEKISGTNKYARSLTPEGFAYSFFMANNPENMTQEERLSREFHGIAPSEFKGAGTEEQIRDTISDNYYDGDLESVRDALKVMRTLGKRPPSIELENIDLANIDQNLPGAKKKLPPGRSPELAAAAQQLQRGEITKKEFDELVNRFRPIPVYTEPLKPATPEQMFDALDTAKREKINPDIKAGTSVGLRLDIPAFNRKGVFVVSIHEKRTPSAAGKTIGYGSVAKIKDVTFGLGKETEALKIAAGASKDVLQTMEGKWVPTNPEEAYREAQAAIKNPEWIQIGIDPTRHSYFYDRRTTQPVIKADEIIQIGNMILGKGVEFGKKEDFLFNIASDPVTTVAEVRDGIENSRKQQLETLARLARKKSELIKKVRNYGSDIETQRLLNELEAEIKMFRLGSAIREPSTSAEAFLKHARDAMDGTGPFREPVLSPDVFATIQAAYIKTPWILEGLRLSIKAPKYPSYLNINPAAGVFLPYERIVRLYSGTTGVEDPVTPRHELMHSLEQMMSKGAKDAVIKAWANSLEKAIKKYTDKRSQEYFNKIMEFLENPSETTRQEALSVLPSYDLYQYINPSEYWAVNAEKLFNSKLGTAWDRFKKAIQKLFEGLKNVFGFNNTYAVHKMFDDLMKTKPPRMGRESLVNYMLSGRANIKFLENVQKVDDLLAKQNVPDTPMLATSVVKTKILNAARDMKDLFKDMIQNPREIPMMAFNGIDYGITYLRNKNIWFGTGLNAADFAKYNGELKTGENLATASLALDNAIRGGNIGIQVIMQGGIKFDDKAKMFVATETKKGMRQVYEAEARLRDELGAQRATNLIQRYLEAKRSRSIQNEYYDRQANLEALKEELADMKADPSTDAKELKEMEREVKQAEDDLKSIELVMSKVRLNDEQIDEVIAMDKDYPDLKEIIDNFQAVNKNLLKFWRQVGMLSENRYNVLSNIKDYVPWYRIMDDAEDVHSPLQSTTRTFTNIGKEKIFKAGKPSVVTDFIAEQDQQVYEIQPANVNRVTINGKKVKPSDMGITSDGKVEIKKQINEGDVVVFYTDREIENIIDNMTRNVMRMTMNGLRQYAATRIVQEYATRNEKGKIMTFPKAEPDNGRFNFIVDGKRVVVEIKDPLVAEAISGMETLGLTMWKPLAAAANLTRRAITLSGTFQLKQVFKDAPTAALVTGVKRPDLLMGGVFKGFVTSLTNSDPAVQILRAAGIGGFHSPARTPEAEVKRQIGVINKNSYDYVIGALDHFGDSSDMAQRVATYKRVLAETGNEAQALYQAANVINFMRHGSGQVAQIVTKTVPFMNAYAQSIDVLFQSLAGGGLKGVSRKRALARIAVTGSLLVGMTLVYCMLVGDDEEYQLLDDQSKLRSYVIPGTKIVLPMNTSAAYFFKAIPEMIYNYVMKNGTDNPMDEKRLRRGLKEAAVDMLLGPNPVPSAVKPFVEIALNKNFFTGETVIPRGMEKLETAEQYNANTSEAGKFLSSMTGGKEKRLLSPVEADHLIRSIFGTAGAMAQWASNVIGEAAETRPAVVARDYPFIGPFLRPEVPRGPEDLFYDFKEYTDKKAQTYNRLIERERFDEADEYLKKNEGLVAFSEYANETEATLKEINALIRMYGETTDKTMSPKEKRAEIENLQRVKNEILGNIEEIRKAAGM